MRNEFECYRAELDRMQLTAESKKALAEGLVRHHPKQRRHSAGLRQGLAAAAMIGLLAAAGRAAAVSDVPTMRDFFFGGDSVGYEQSGSFVGKAVENQGWNLSITDCVGDDYYIYLGMELEAPEGTVLDAADYDFKNSSVRFADRSLYGSWGIRPLPDEDPTDNKLPMMWLLYSSQPGVNGAAVRLKVSDFGHNWFFDGGETFCDLDCRGTWDFGSVTIHYPDNILRRTPDVPVRAILDGSEGQRGVDAVVSEIQVSPLALYVKISSEALILHHEPSEWEVGGTYYNCNTSQEVLAWDADGQPVAMSAGMELASWTGHIGKSQRMGGGGCSGTNENEGYIWLVYGFNGLTDVNRIATVVVNGTAIPLQ